MKIEIPRPKNPRTKTGITENVIEVLKMYGVFANGVSMVADLGCGSGDSTMNLLDAFPKIRKAYVADYYVGQFEYGLLCDPRVQPVVGLMPESLGVIPSFDKNGVVIASFVESGVFKRDLKGLEELVRITGKGKLIVAGDTPLDESALEVGGFKKQKIFPFLDVWNRR